MKGAPGITRDKNGTYRWVYEFHLMRNPVIFGTILKIFAVMAVIEMAFITVLGVVEGAPLVSTAALAAKTGLMIIALFFVLTAIGYTIYAANNGWKYCVLFEMDEEGITHKQLPRQYKKAQAMAAITALVGAMAGDAGAVGRGILSASHDSISSTFANVRSVKVSRFWHYLKVNEPFAKNQVYAEAEDFPFVCDFILSHVDPNVARKAGWQQR